MDLKITQLDLLGQGKRALPRRIRGLESKLRRAGIRTKTVQAVSTRPATRSADSSNDPAERPLADTSAEQYTLADGSLTAAPVRPNLLRNGSFEFYQNGSLTPYAWTGTGTVLEPSVPTMDAQYVAELGSAESLEQVVTESGLVPAGSWVFSFWAYSAAGTDLLVSASPAWAVVEPTVAGLFRITAIGAEPSSSVPAGEWTRFFMPVITGEAGAFTIYVENDGANTLYLDAAKLEVQVGETATIEPTEYSPDATAGATIVRELRADNIIAGTLAVGGSDSTNPVIEVYDATDNLIVTIGEPSGGVRGIEVLGEAGIKVQPGGTLEAGSFFVDDIGAAVILDAASDPENRGYRLVNAAGAVVGSLYGWFSGNASHVYLSAVDRGDAADVAITAEVAGNTSGENAKIILRASNNSATNGTDDTAELVIEGRYTTRPKITATAHALDLGNGDGAYVQLVHVAPGQANILVKATNDLDLDATGLVKIKGQSRAWPTVAGTVAQGADTVSGSSTNSVSGANHSHAADAYSAPGTTANRLIKTGAAGLVELADLNATTFSIDGRVLTAAVSGTIALGAATVTATSTNSVSSANHSHAATASSSAAASTLVATDSLGELVAKLKTTSVINHPGWTDASSLMTTAGNGWVDFGAPFAEAGYYKDITGRVYLRGLIKSGTINTTIMTLPAGYRPAFQHMWTVPSNLGQVRIDVTTAGVVSTQGAPAGTYTYLSLDVISFQTQ